MGAIIAVISKKEENAAEAAVAMLKTLKHKRAEAFGIASSTTMKRVEHIEALENQKDIDSPIIIGHIFSEILASDKPQPQKLEDVTLVLEGRIYSTGNRIMKVETVKNFVKETAGFFAFAMAQTDNVIAGRDPMGIYPFYYGENRDFAALSSERKALWKIEIKNAKSFPPGHLATVNKNGFKFEDVKTLSYSKPKEIEMRTAVRNLQTLLTKSVRETVAGLRELAIAFSGGLDSSIIASLAKNLGATVHLIHVSLQNQLETEHAKEVAEELNLPISICLYSESDVEKVLRKVSWLIEEADPIKTSIGIPFYWVAEKAAEKNFEIMLAGQGADEMFGGYKRYVTEYLRFGKKHVQKTIFNDIVRMYETNFERDFKICNYHNVELRLPFAAYQIAKLAVELPLKFKMEMRDEGLRKLVLRQVAKNLGLPQLVVNRPKKAVQYATGVSKVLEKLAHKKGKTIREYVEETSQRTFERALP